MTTLTVDLEGRRLVFEAGDFPLGIGGDRPHIPLGDESAGAPVAHLGQDHGDIFIQPAGTSPDAVAMSCNGVARPPRGGSRTETESPSARPAWGTGSPPVGAP